MFVCKFGGSSLADSDQIKKVKAIIDSSRERRIVVVSAPGKRNPEDIKITDLLYSCARAASRGESIDSLFAGIESRFIGICSDLGIDSSDIAEALSEVKQNIIGGSGPDYAASRGEFLSAKVLSSYFDMEFIDALDVIRLTSDGRVDEQSYALLKDRIEEGKKYILPGFYGADPEGKVKTFSRGGSDITGAIAARAAGADMYENWTDVSGLLMADPRIFENPPGIGEITYREIREMAVLGANVFHEEAIAPVKDAGIPINIRNTNDPAAGGTVIMESRKAEAVPVAGVSGKDNYLPVYVEKFMLGRYPGFHSDILERLNAASLAADFVFYGSDSITYLVKQAEGVSPDKIKDALFGAPYDRIEVESPAAVVGVVGEGIRNLKDVGAKVFTLLSSADINVRFTSFGGSRVSLLIGVNETDFKGALKAVYSALQ